MPLTSAYAGLQSGIAGAFAAGEGGALGSQVAQMITDAIHAYALQAQVVIPALVVAVPVTGAPGTPSPGTTVPGTGTVI